jgi:hypothetical protein
MTPDQRECRFLPRVLLAALVIAAVAVGAGLSAVAYFNSLGISWAATICHMPLRFSQVSVHVSLTVCFRPSVSV